MKIFVNGKETEHLPDMTLQVLLSELSVKESAIAVNETFVPRHQYQQTLLSDGDRVEIVTPMQGG